MRLHRVRLRRRSPWRWFLKREDYPEGVVVTLSAGWLLAKLMIAR